MCADRRPVWASKNVVTRIYRSSLVLSVALRCLTAAASHIQLRSVRKTEKQKRTPFYNNKHVVGRPACAPLLK